VIDSVESRTDQKTLSPSNARPGRTSFGWQNRPPDKDARSRIDMEMKTASGYRLFLPRPPRRIPQK